MNRASASAGRHRTEGRLYYGWVLVLALAITETTSFGVLYYAFTVFLAPMHASTGWSIAALTGGFSLAQLVSGGAGLVAGRWLDRHGPRLLMTVGSVFASALVLAWSRVESLLAYYLVWAGIGLSMAAVLYEPAFLVVATWFRRRRARALTLLTFIAGFASVIYIPLAGWLVRAQGWRGALVTLAVVLAVSTIPIHALVLRRRPSDLGLLPDGASPAEVGAATPDAGASLGEEPSVTMHAAVRRAAFWWLATAFCLNTLGQVAVSVHLVPYLIEHGQSATFAASMAGLIGVMALPGRLVFTPLGDYVPRGYLTALIFTLQAVALSVLLTLPGPAGVILFVVVFGAGFGAITPMKAALVAEFYGPASYGSINGAVSLFVTTARAAGPIGVGLAYGASGSYRPVFWLLVGLSLSAAVAILMAHRSAGYLRAQ